MPETTPQDRKVKDEGFTFTVKGKKYRLPEIPEGAADAVPFSITQDALMYPDDNGKQMGLGFHLLTLSKPDEKALAALRSLPTGEAVEIIGAWVGEASGSSE